MLEEYEAPKFDKFINHEQISNQVSNQRRIGSLSKKNLEGLDESNQEFIKKDKRINDLSR